MKRDLIRVIRRVCRFTGHHLTEYRILLLDDALYVDNFRQVSHYFRPGVTNGSARSLARWVPGVADHQPLLLTAQEVAGERAHHGGGEAEAGKVRQKGRGATYPTGLSKQASA